jgi:hypothetical protein
LQELRFSQRWYLLGYNAVQPVEIQQTFRKKISPTFSGSKNSPSKNPEGSAIYLLLVDLLIGLFFDPEDGGDMFLRNVG